jgi:hypothetical protein
MGHITLLPSRPWIVHNTSTSLPSLQLEKYFVQKQWHKATRALPAARGRGRWPWLGARDACTWNVGAVRGRLVGWFG